MCHRTCYCCCSIGNDCTLFVSIYTFLLSQEASQLIQNLPCYYGFICKYKHAYTCHWHGIVSTAHSKQGREFVTISKTKK